MKFTVAFSGPAWTGVNTAGLIVWDYFTKLWYDVVGDKEYQSIIKWWNNTFIVYISDNGKFLSSNIDLFFAYDKLAITRNEKVYNLKNIVEIEKTDMINMVSVAMFFTLLWKNIEEIKQIVKDYFWNKKIPQVMQERNEKALLQWAKLIENWWGDLKINGDLGNKNNDKLWIINDKLKKDGYPELVSGSKNKKQLNQEFIDGNWTVAEWAVDADLSFYSAYPMTPASTIIKYITKHKNVEFFQWEDEIAVAMSMLGARFAGKRAMCGTSGGGFALMTETISMANQMEIWWVYILSQRWWPSTWTPTFTEQWDLLYALNASFWDTKPIVVYPSNIQNAYDLTQKVLNWADYYQHPIIILLDKQFSESYFSQDLKRNLDSKDENIDKIKYNPKNSEKFLAKEDLENNKFLRYKLTEDWISPYTYPGVKNWDFIATSYEHTQSWSTTEDPEIKVQMTEKRHQKLETFKKNEFNQNFKWFEVINESAKKFFITMWINRLVLEEYVRQNPEYGIIVIEVLQPLDDGLQNFIEGREVEKLIFVELNYSGQLESYLTWKLWLNCEKWNWKISRIRKYNNYPLFLEDLK